jgi:hypothetical protein
VFPYHLAKAIQAAAADMIPQPRMQAAHRVATMLSATEISIAAIHFYCAYYTHLFVRESWLCHVFLPRLDSNFFGDTLQNAKQLIFSRLLQMTKYCVMRERDKIHSWISLSGDLVLSHQQGIYSFEFPKRFSWRSFPEISLLHLFCISKDRITNPLMPFHFAFTWLNAFQAVRHSLNWYLSTEWELIKKIHLDGIINFLWGCHVLIPLYIPSI